MRYTPRDYQARATEFILEHPRCALWLEMGLGKTAATLAALRELLWTGEASRVLIVAPMRVAYHVWPDEISKWREFQSLTHTAIRGDAWWRLRQTERQTDIHLINYENLKWLVEHRGGSWPYDTVVLDESSRVKNHASHRFAALKKVSRKISRLVELTGTPSPNGLVDLWAPAYLLDAGERLGTTVTAFRQRWFLPNRGMESYKPTKNAQTEVEQRLGDIVVSMKSADYLTLPPFVSNVVEVELPQKCMSDYRQLEEEMFLRLLADDTEHKVEAFNAAALTNKCLQYASGAVYLHDPVTGQPTGAWAETHNAKLDALEEVVEEAGGAPVLVVYWFRSDLERLQKRFPHARTIDKAGRAIAEWNEGKIPMLLINPGSAGHGLNLQAGGHIMVWFSQQWSLELYQQTNARLYRQGQTKPVYVHHLVARGTLDEDVLTRLATKASVQDLLMERLKARKEAA